MDSQTIRKTNKPLIEKRRRERINKSLEQMKSLVLKGTNKENNVRLEKADIMDMTVRYVEDLQQRQRFEDQEKSQLVLKSYIQGYSSCINEVVTTLNGARIISDDVKYNLSSHLAARLYAFSAGHQQHVTFPGQSSANSTSGYLDSEDRRITSTPNHSFIADMKSPAQLSPIFTEQSSTTSPAWSSIHSVYSATSPSSTSSIDSGVYCPPDVSVWRPW